MTYDACQQPVTPQGPDGPEMGPRSQPHVSDQTAAYATLSPHTHIHTHLLSRGLPEDAEE